MHFKWVVCSHRKKQCIVSELVTYIIDIVGEVIKLKPDLEFNL